MLVNRLSVMAIATLSALIAGGGMVALAKGRTAPVRAISRSADGHFWTDGLALSDVGRVRVHFLVDTGASTVALTAQDARRLGLNTRGLNYSLAVSTAQGNVQAAPVILPSLNIAGVEIQHVRALVLPEGPQTSLLGMNFLGQLSKIEVTPTMMVLQR